MPDPSQSRCVNAELCVQALSTRPGDVKQPQIPKSLLPGTLRVLNRTARTCPDRNDYKEKSELALIRNTVLFPVPDPLSLHVEQGTLLLMS